MSSKSLSICPLNVFFCNTCSCHPKIALPSLILLTCAITLIGVPLFLPQLPVDHPQVIMQPTESKLVSVSHFLGALNV